MWQKATDLIIYKDPRFYSAFPAAVTLADGDVLVSFRRALEPRWLLPDDAPAELRGWVNHVEARSHQALVRLDGETLEPRAPARAMPMNPEAADQDSSLLRCASGRIVLGAFSWHPFPAKFGDAVRAHCGSCVGSPNSTGDLYLQYGGFTRYSDDDGATWSDHLYLPPLPGHPDIIPGKRPRHGGAVRGRPVEADGEILMPTYAAHPDTGKSAAHVFASSDEGETWEYHACMALDADGKVDMHEPGLHVCPSGKVVCFIRTAGLDDHLVTTESLDNGRTWSPWQERQVTGHPYNPVSLPDGRVFLIYGYRHEPFGIRARVLDPECTNMDDAEEIIIRDDGLGGDLGYPWATVLADGRVLSTYYIYGDDGIRHIAGSVLGVGH